MKLPLLPALLLIVATGCPSPDDRYDDHPVDVDLAHPVALTSTLAFIDRGEPAVLFVDPAAKPIGVRSVKTGKRPTVFTANATRDAVLVLSAGDPGSPGVVAEAPQLHVIPADARAAYAVPLASRYDALSVSPDGRFAVASFSPDSGAKDQGLFNPNELTIVDLRAASGVAAPPRTLRSFGSVPLGIAFSPRLEGGRLLPDGARSLAVVLSRGYVTIIDLDHPERSEITVALTLPDDPRTITPVQVLFDPLDPTIYVRVDGADDVYVLKLVDVPAAMRVSNDFFPSLSQIGAGVRPSDMALYDAGEGTRLLVVASGSAQASIVDAQSSAVTAIPLGFPATRATVFSAAAPGDPQVRVRAVLTGGGGQMAFLDLAHIEQMKTRNLDLRSLGITAPDVVPLPELGSLLAIGAGTQGVSVVDLARRTSAPLLASTKLDAFALGTGRLWFRVGGGDRVGSLALATLTPSEVRLDRSVRALVPLPGAAGVPPLLVVVHDDPLGAITVLDAAAPDRMTARSADGLFLTNVLERGDK